MRNLDPVAFLANTYLSPTMLVVFVLAVVSMIVSTATSAVLAPATILGHNLLARIPFFRKEKPLLSRSTERCLGVRRWHFCGNAW